MAGHSQFKNIMYRKGAQDAKRAKQFTKLIRELTVAARTGQADPAANPRLRAAIAAARNANMPKDTMERAIKRGASAGEGDNYVEMRYEGYGPGGVAIIVEALTDNRNRTAGDVRVAFDKHGGNAGRDQLRRLPVQPRRRGRTTRPDAAKAEEMFEAALEAGASDVQSGPDGHEVICAPDDLNAVREALEARFGEAERRGAGLAAADHRAGRRGQRRDAVPPARCAGRQRRRAVGGGELRDRRRADGAPERLRRAGRPGGKERTPMRFLGLDPGLRVTGWGVVEAEGSRLRHVADGAVGPIAARAMGERLAALHEGWPR